MEARRRRLRLVFRLRVPEIGERVPPRPCRRTVALWDVQADEGVFAGVVIRSDDACAFVRPADIGERNVKRWFVRDGDEVGIDVAADYGGEVVRVGRMKARAVRRSERHQAEDDTAESESDEPGTPSC